MKPILLLRSHKTVFLFYVLILILIDALDLTSTFLGLNAGYGELNPSLPDYKNYLSPLPFLLYFGRISFLSVFLFSFLFYISLLKLEHYRPPTGEKSFLAFQNYNFKGGFWRQLVYPVFPYRGWCLGSGLLVSLMVPLMSFCAASNNFLIYFTGEGGRNMIHLLLRKLAFSQHIAYPISIILFYVLIGIISYIFASFIAWKLVWSL